VYLIKDKMYFVGYVFCSVGRLGVIKKSSVGRRREKTEVADKMEVNRLPYCVQS
jgi:hypothetical protein